MKQRGLTLPGLAMRIWKARLETRNRLVAATGDRVIYSFEK